MPWVRQLVIDAGRASRRRHPIHGLFEVDVTSPRQAIRTNRLETGEQLSFTAFVVGCVADGAAAARFARRLRTLLTTSDGLELPQDRAARDFRPCTN